MGERTGRLEGKAAIVTGAGGGIGAATAELFCREGAKVLLADIRLDAVEAQAQGLREAGCEAVAFELDLGDPASIRAMVEAAVDAFGQLHILDNNAAATNLAQKDGGVEGMDPAVWDETMQVNLRGPMLAAQAAIPHMRRAGGGAIINILSNSAFGADVVPTAYAASKGGLAVLTKYLATQHGQEGIRCNAVSPGLIHIAEKSTPQREAFRDMMRSHELAARSGTPMDIAHAVAFLASDDAGFINGQILHVDGGALAHSPQFADGARMRRGQSPG
jgi:NAD(P)-dependent dehydrogenase (short-subunit alcohol dehydrogenase family)